jgi:hypothetical protein
MYKKQLLFFCLLIITLSGFAQTPDSIYLPSIRTPQLYLKGNQLAYPIITLNGNQQLELSFDDLDADIKNYSYTYQLCNADWTPAPLNQFDYIKGFSQANIPTSRLSSYALTRYTHYVAIVPDANCIPSRSGNYILKVYLDGDTSKMAFTRRFLVVDNRISVSVQFLQPYDPLISHSHQKLQLTLNTRDLDVMNPMQQIKVWILQNNRWDNAIHDVQPTFYSGNTVQYTRDNDFVFPGGKEWRWVDLRSFRYQSDRIKHADYLKNSTTIYVSPDADRSQQTYFYFKDYNGRFYIQTTESVNPYTQGDYARVKFTFVPPGNVAFPDKDLYIIGQFTDYSYNDSTRMQFNSEHGIYEASFFLKMGYYNYSYVTVDKNDPLQRPSFEFTEGSHNETENDYTVLVYYRSLSGRADELLAISNLNTLTSTR